MKTLNITFTDAEYTKLEKSKKLHINKSWHEFVLRLCNNEVSIKKRVSSGSHPRNKQKPLSSKQEDLILNRREE
jgi:hypothetical protein